MVFFWVEYMKKSIDVYQEIIDKLNKSYIGDVEFSLNHDGVFASITMDIKTTDDICSGDIEFYIECGLCDMVIDGNLKPFDLVVINGY